MTTNQIIEVPVREPDLAAAFSAKTWESLLKDVRTNSRLMRLVGADLERRRLDYHVVYGLDRDIIYAFQYPAKATLTDATLVQDTLRLSHLPIAILPGAFIELWRDIASICVDFSVDFKLKKAALRSMNSESKLGTQSAAISSLVEQINAEKLLSKLPPQRLLRLAPAVERLAEILTKPSYVPLKCLVPEQSVGSIIEENQFWGIANELARYSSSRSEKTRNNAADALSWVIVLAANEFHARGRSQKGEKYYIPILTKTDAFDSVAVLYDWKTDPLRDSYGDENISILREPSHLTIMDQISAYGTANTMTRFNRYLELKNAYDKIESIIQDLILRVGRSANVPLRELLSRRYEKEFLDLKEALSNEMVTEIQRKFQLNRNGSQRFSIKAMGEFKAIESTVDLVKLRADMALFLTLLVEEYRSNVDTIVRAASPKEKSRKFWLARPIEEVLGIQPKIRKLPYGKRLLLGFPTRGLEITAAVAVDYHRDINEYICYWSCFTPFVSFATIVEEELHGAPKWRREDSCLVGKAPWGEISLEIEGESGWAPRVVAITGSGFPGSLSNIIARTLPISIPALVIKQNISEFVKKCKKESG